jgi:hypothetical protein
MDVKDMAEKRINMESLRRKRRGEETYILSSPSLPFDVFFNPVVYHALWLFY